MWLWLLLVIPVLIGFSLWRYFRGKRPHLTFSQLSPVNNVSRGWRTYGIWLAPLLQWAAVALIILALARPQLKNTTVKRYAEGIDIMLVLDISTSMRAEDLKPNRFEAARNVAKKFINNRRSDRIGLVVFAGNSYTVVPPTLDYELLKNMLSEVEMGVIKDGTAIGMGIATAVNRLKDSKAESKVIILLTDGQNNAGKIDPLTAASLARTFGIKIYTIGVGTHGTAPYPVTSPIFGTRYQQVEVNINEEMLTRIANMTGGQYFRATDNQALQKIYARIDKLETTEIKEIIYTETKDLYLWFLLPALGLLILSIISEKIFFRTTLA